MKKNKLTLTQRIQRIEQIIICKLRINLNVETCPKCKQLSMNAWQEGYCNECAFRKGEQI